MRVLFIAALMMLSGCSEPDFRDLEGKGLYLATLKEKAMVVNYWATWCAPCIKEIPELNELAAEEAARLTVLGVNFDHPEGEERQKQARKMKIEFPVLTSEPAEQLGVPVPEVLPTTYVFNPGGELVATLVGPQTKASILATLTE